MKLQEIFELVLENYKTRDIGKGICYELLLLYLDNVITRYEKTLAKEFLTANRPSVILHTGFYNRETYIKTYNTEMGYWWPIRDMSGKPIIEPERVRFIEHLITLCKEQNL